MPPPHKQKSDRGPIAVVWRSAINCRRPRCHYCYRICFAVATIVILLLLYRKQRVPKKDWTLAKAPTETFDSESSLLLHVSLGMNR